MILGSDILAMFILVNLIVATARATRCLELARRYQIVPLRLLLLREEVLVGCISVLSIRYGLLCSPQLIRNDPVPIGVFSHARARDPALRLRSNLNLAPLLTAILERSNTKTCVFHRGGTLADRAFILSNCAVLFLRGHLNLQFCARRLL